MYTARISRNNPTAFIVLIDQSGSMADKTIFEGQMMTKAEAVAVIVDMMIEELLLRCRKDGFYNDYFEMAILGYGGSGVRSLLKSGTVDGFVLPSQLAEISESKSQICRERVLPSGRSVMSQMKHKVWVPVCAEGSTPMYEALKEACRMAEQWVASHRESFPVMVFNITDGEASDADDNDLKSVASSIKQLHTADGNVLLFNIHISSTVEPHSVLFPQTVGELPDNRYAHLLFEISSVMPEIFADYVNSMRDQIGEGGFRAMSYNTHMNELIGVMNVGSVSMKLI